MDAYRKHYREIKRILLLILLLNWAVAAAKIIYGMISRCGSMSADGFHSFSDGASNIIGLAGIILACQPKDKDHPYGHKKYETLFSLIIAGLLAFLCFNLLKQGISRLFHPVIPEIDIRSFLVMIVTLGVNIWVMKYERRKGEILKSDILVSDALHTKADILTSLSVIAALGGMKLGLSTLLDPLATILITLFIAHEAIEIFRRSSRVLCDSVVIVDEKKIADIVLAVKGVRACHKIRSRGRSDDIYIDLHVQVDADMHVDQAHKISYVIEGAIKQGLPDVSDVVVHIEPKEKI